MKKIYTSYCSNFSGCFARDTDEYWKKWVKNEDEDFIVVESNGKIRGFFGAGEETWSEFPEQKFVHLFDFSVDEESYSRDHGESLFNELWSAWTNLFQEKLKASVPSVFESIIVPGAIAKNWKNKQEPFRTEQGFMYKSISGHSINIQTEDHLFWRSDRF